MLSRHTPCMALSSLTTTCRPQRGVDRRVMTREGHSVGWNQGRRTQGRHARRLAAGRDSWACPACPAGSTAAACAPASALLCRAPKPDPPSAHRAGRQLLLKAVGAAGAIHVHCVLVFAPLWVGGGGWGGWVCVRGGEQWGAAQWRALRGRAPENRAGVGAHLRRRVARESKDASSGTENERGRASMHG